MIPYILFAALCMLSNDAQGQEYSATGRTYISQPNVSVAYLRANKPLNVTCILRDGASDKRVEWYRGSTLIAEDSSSHFYVINSVHRSLNGALVSSLRKDNYVSRSDSGNYRCQPVGQPTDAYYIGIVVFDIVGTGHVLRKAYEDAQLHCQVEGLPTGVTVQSVTWERLGVRVVTVENRFKVEVYPNNLNTTLTVYSVQPHSIGNYTCIFELSAPLGAESAVVSIDSMPQAKFAERSVNMVEGDSATLVCGAWGMPLPTVAWFMRSEDSEEDDPLFPLPDDGRFTTVNYSLIVGNVTKADRANYVCIASNVHGNNTAAVLLRIKGQYAALWPLLGVIMEIIILVIIIGTYEYLRGKKRRREEAEERREVQLANEHSEYQDGSRQGKKVN